MLQINISKTSKRIVLVALLILAAITAVLIFNKDAEAASSPCYSRSYARPYSISILNCLTPDIRNTVIPAEDQGTRDILEEDYGEGVDSAINNMRSSCNGISNDAQRRRCRINRSSPYAILSWVSERNDPNDDNIQVPAGSSISLPLQINQMRFLSSSVINPINDIPSSDTFNYGSDRVSDITWWAGLPSDRSPILGAPRINQATQRDTRITFTGSSVRSGGGSITNMSGRVVNAPHDPQSRYWFYQPRDITYQNAGGFTSDTTVQLEFKYKAITESGSIYHCFNNAGIGKSSLFDSPSNCPEITFRVSFDITAQDSFNLAAEVQKAPSDTAISASNTVSPGDVVRIRATVTNTGPSTATNATLYIRPMCPSSTSSCGAGRANGQYGRFEVTGVTAFGGLGSIAANTRDAVWVNQTYAPGNHNREATFRISNSAPNNQLICFRSQVAPRSGTSGAWDYSTNNPKSYCITVIDNRLTSYLQALGNDVHAGGGLTSDFSDPNSCNPVNYPDPRIRFSSTVASESKSYGQFIVSALRDVTSPIQNFGSANEKYATGGLGELSFGIASSAYKYCRPEIDYFALRDELLVNPPPDVTVVKLNSRAEAEDLNSFFANPSYPPGKYILIDMAVRWTPTAVEKSYPALSLPIRALGVDQSPPRDFDSFGPTITIPKGYQVSYLSSLKTSIAADIERETGPYSSLDDIPAFSVMSTSSGIVFYHEVTEAFGVYYSNEQINTCGSIIASDTPGNVDITNPAQVDLCQDPLNVYGMFSTQDAYYRRITPDSGGSKTEYAESIEYIPELYLSRPPLIEYLTEQFTDNRRLQLRNELPPRL